MMGLLRERSFAGRFNARGADYTFTFTPAAAAIEKGKLKLTGRLSIKGPRGAVRSVDNIAATLVASQGAVGVAPERRQLIAGTVQTGNIATPAQKQEQAKAPESVQEPAAPPATSALPLTDATGPRGYVAAMFFHLAPLDNRALGVPIDLSKVQLNARLAPVSDIERDQLWLYTDLVAALYGDKPDEAAAAGPLGALNQVLKG
jgi:hypothetical protein